MGIVMVDYLGAEWSGETSTFSLKDLSGQKQIQLCRHVHLEPGKRCLILEQNHNAHDEYTVLERCGMGQ